MHYARTYKIIAFYLIFILLSPAGARAAAITNLDSKPHSIEVNGSEISIDAGATWRIPGKVKVHYHGQEIPMEENNEYAIWNDHDFGPQRRFPTGSGAMDR